jgi:plasmid stability protein
MLTQLVGDVVSDLLRIRVGCHERVQCVEDGVVEKVSTALQCREKRLVNVVIVAELLRDITRC